MKKLSIIALSAMLMTAPAFAETSANYNTNQTVGQEVDLSAIFADNQNLQVATLSTQEMQETEGAWVANAVGATIGGLTGHFGYMGSVAASGQYNFANHMGAVGIGTASGFFNPGKSALKAIAMTEGGKAVATGVVTIGGTAITGHMSNKVKTLNVK